MSKPCYGCVWVGSECLFVMGGCCLALILIPIAVCKVAVSFCSLWFLLDRSLIGDDRLIVSPHLAEKIAQIEICMVIIRVEAKAVLIFANRFLMFAFLRPY